MFRPPLPNREQEVSRPPSYRSRSSASNVETSTSVRVIVPLEMVADYPTGHHQHHVSLSDEASSTTQALIHNSNCPAVVDADNNKQQASSASPITYLHHHHRQDSPGKRDNNMVTIVQTTNCSQVLSHDSSPILVTVTSPANHSTNNSQNLTVLAQL